MLSNRLTQHGVKTDLSNLGPDDIASMVGRAETTKEQAKNATVYVRAAKVWLKSWVKIKANEVDLHKSANDALKEVDRHQLSIFKSNLDHQTHAAKMQAKADGAERVATAKTMSVVEIEQARTHYQLISMAAKHRAAIAAARPKRQGLLGIFR